MNELQNMNGILKFLCIILVACFILLVAASYLSPAGSSLSSNLYYFLPETLGSAIAMAIIAYPIASILFIFYKSKVRLWHLIGFIFSSLYSGLIILSICLLSHDLFEQISYLPLPFVFGISLVVSLSVVYLLNYGNKIDDMDYDALFSEKKTSLGTNENYYAEAEQEIIEGNMNKGVWAKALVEAKGNEVQRKAEYIKMRAKQLKKENQLQQKAEEDMAKQLQRVEKEQARKQRKEQQEMMNKIEADWSGLRWRQEENEIQTKTEYMEMRARQLHQKAEEEKAQ